MKQGLRRGPRMTTYSDGGKNLRQIQHIQSIVEPLQVD
jgi:hypothetical protein